MEDLFNILPVPEAARRLADGSLPARAACVTFDDGYINNHQIAAPILEERGFPATFFIASGAVHAGIMWNDLIIETFSRSREQLIFDSESGLGRSRSEMETNSAALGNVLATLKYKPLEERWRIAQQLFNANVGESLPRLMMTRDMVLDLFNRGFDIGGHTVNHPILKELSDICALDEIENSVEWIRNVTGSKPFSFAYPNGKLGTDFTERHMAMVANAGCEVAFSTDWGVGKSTTNELNLPRIGPWWRTGRTVPMGLLRLYGRSYSR
jgi:peptidoglycan/xylan/chitin deacetylase (PgdA/CDA1 family)